MTMKAKLQQLSSELTAAERRIMTVVLSDFPFSGLGSIQELSERAQVSAPSITRFVTKLGIAGYQEFQRLLIDELKASARAPVDSRFAEMPEMGAGFLHDYFAQVHQRLDAVSQAVSAEDFEALCELLTSRSRSIYIVGGRVSQSLARLLAVNLQFFRADVHLVPSDPEEWPFFLQQMKKRDVLIFIDFRRYQKSLERLARVAADHASPRIVLLTDQWLSPISGFAAHTLAMPIALGTVWDSYAAATALIEALVAAVAQKDWDATRSRIEAWDALRINPDDPATPVLFDDEDAQ